MQEIHLLDKHTIDQIAAGEVIERPFSVVKELTENAIDSGATSVSIEIRDGGISLIRVTDNGAGIDESQIKKAFLRHATSKIQTASDLSFIHTLGFRGEALSSIAAISRLELCTKTKDAFTGFIYKIEGGQELSFQEAGLPNGTTVLVRDLFYNTPARLKFLKSPQAEAAYVTTIVEKIALSHPQIAVKYSINGKLKLQTKGSGNLKDTIYGIFGRDITSSLIEVHASLDCLRIDGFIGNPTVERSTRSLENYFINGRYIKDKVIERAIEEAYKGYQMKGAFPFTALYFTIEPELIDVNVHPSKMEIRFYNNELIFESISSCLRKALEEREHIPAVSLEDKAPSAGKPTLAPNHAEPFELLRAAKENLWAAPKPQVALPEDWVSEEAAYALAEPVYELEEPAQEPTVTYEQASFDTAPFLSVQAKKAHRIVGEVFATYWIVEYENEMYIVDQHAAHEKVLYETFLKRAKEGSVYAQQIAPALILTLTPKEEEVLSRFSAQFQKMGFSVEYFGGSEYALQAVPTQLPALNDRQAFLSFLEELCEHTGRLSSSIAEERIATAACKAAVKGNQRLSLAEADALLTQLLSLENPYRCPHGRPTIIKLSKQELEKKFKRLL